MLRKKLKKLCPVYDLRIMVERSRSLRIPGAETTDLRIALYERKEVIERLQKELYAEREASATSASEALSMILRLQGEKAELAMEAAHYKRMVDEKMCHAEISFAVLEDLIHQKEIEVTALSHQVEVYRSKLLSLGFKIQEDDDEQDENMLKMISDRSQTPSPELDIDLSVPEEKEVIEESLDSPMNSLDVYWEQIKRLNEQVKELTGFRDSMRDQDKSPLSESGVNKGEQCLASSSNFEEDTETKEEVKDLSRTNDTMVIKVSQQKKMEKKSSKPTRDRSGKRNHAEYQAELLRLRQRVERLERGKTNIEPETSGVIKQEEVSLMKEMKEEPSTAVQLSEVKRLNKMENLESWIDPTVISVQEAMLYFWL